MNWLATLPLSKSLQPNQGNSCAHPDERGKVFAASSQAGATWTHGDGEQEKAWQGDTGIGGTQSTWQAKA